MKNILIVGFITVFYNIGLSQVKGVVLGSNNKTQEPIYGAKVRLLNSQTGAITNEEGKFELILPKELPDTMVFTAMGYYSDTVIVNKDDRFISFKVILYSDLILPEMVVTYKKGTHGISRLKTLQVEEIGAGELRKAACCNLSESFETNASVDVNITDAVSGAKKIQMMGLDGVYTQLQLENIPYLRGLESAFGLNSMPGTWIESIQITKGSGTVVNGYESMAGLVNMELKKPESMEALYLNGYVNAMGRSELNFNSGFKLNEKWSSGWFAHGSVNPMEIDRNNDKFNDVPTGVNASVFNRYHYHGKKMEAQFGANAYIDQKQGGQINRGKLVNPYKVDVDSKHVDAFAKTGFFLKKPGHSIGVVYNAKYHEIDALFGQRSFKGVEKRGYVNAILDGYFGTTLHKYKFGINGVYIDIAQKLDTITDNRLEIVPGVFGEYNYSGIRLSAVVGARLDYHNLFKEQFSPRLHLKYLLTETMDARFTVGRGWRVPNYMIDNISLMATSRNWISPDTVKPEVSWNIGGSLFKEFEILSKKVTLSLDFYYTKFENQLVVDRDISTTAIKFVNLNYKSFSNSFQAEFSLNVSKSVDVRLAYKYLDVKSEFGGKIQQKVMVPNHRGFVNFGYKSRNKKWEYDITMSIFGESRLPVTLLQDSTLTTVNKSEVYPMLSSQITYNHKKWEFYLGGENLANYTQKNPIIDAASPFSNRFDATRIWAPVMGVNVYAGIRFSIKQKKEEE